jgi:hypothetical protein
MVEYPCKPSRQSDGTWGRFQDRRVQSGVTPEPLAAGFIRPGAAELSLDASEGAAAGAEKQRRLINLLGDWRTCSARYVQA